MAGLMNPRAEGCLERSCGDWIRAAPPSPGLERIEAHFSGHGFDPHRHDTYAIGFTLRGVQAFRYRGAAQRSTAGEVFVLHPDETHDGHAGTSAGFRYRILYLEPRLVQEALGGAHPLPFVRDAVSVNARLMSALAPALDDMEAPLEELQRDAIIAGLAQALAEADRSLAPPRMSPASQRAVALGRARLDETGAVTSAELEALTGLSRYALARHFRACLGTSPHRYLTMRRLDRARTLIRRGTPLADAALACGFADQSHMTRQFKKTYGVSPGRFAALAA
ncbi:MAG TPA: AraC family transcriptional regulator [Xanthobacteraceae bacterium]|nr:AraC family transcriptional regulator [Xanthobacteraceae bacterium]